MRTTAPASAPVSRSSQATRRTQTEVEPAPRSQLEPLSLARSNPDTMQRCELLKMVGRRCHDRQCPARDAERARAPRGCAKREAPSSKRSTLASRSGTVCQTSPAHRRDPQVRANRVVEALLWMRRTRRPARSATRPGPPRGGGRCLHRRRRPAAHRPRSYRRRALTSGRGQRREVARLEHRGPRAATIAASSPVMGRRRGGQERHVSVAGDVEGMAARAARGSAPDCEPA